MKAIIPASYLQTAFNAIKPAIGNSKTDNPTLLVVIDDDCGIAATNGQLVAQARLGPVGIEVKSHGRTGVKAERIGDVIKHLSKGEVEIELMKSGLKFKQGKFRTILPIVPAQDVAVDFNLPDPEAELPLDAATLLQGLRTVSWCAARGDVRYFLNGVLLEFNEDGTTTFVATDGHRLASKNLPFAAGLSGQHIVSNDTVTALEAFLLNNDNIALSGNEHGLQLVGEAGSLKVPLVDGKYPEWRRVQRTDLPNRVTFQRDAARMALSHAGSVADPKFKGVKVAISGQCLSISANSEYGECSDEVALSGNTLSKEALIGYNWTYLEEVLRRAETDEVVMTLSDSPENDAVYFPCEGGGVTVMPMRI